MAALTGYSIPLGELFDLAPRDVMMFEEAVEAARRGADGGDEH